MIRRSDKARIIIYMLFICAVLISFVWVTAYTAKVQYDINKHDFLIPALTLQPIVENAIRHGVRIRENGLVTVRTRRTEEGHVIEIRDNGKGFDVKADALSDPTHIGIRNVRERIEQMCGGTLTIESVLDKGTTVLILIPPAISV